MVSVVSGFYLYLFLVVIFKNIFQFQCNMFFTKLRSLRGKTYSIIIIENSLKITEICNFPETFMDLTS